MTYTDQDRQKARELLAGRDPKQLGRLVHEVNNQLAHEAEMAKTTGFDTFALPFSEFDTMCRFLLDGGGVDDDTVDLGDTTPAYAGKGLLDSLMQALHDRDQPKVWKLLPQMLKHRLKIRGAVTPLGPQGGVRMNGAPSKLEIASDIPTAPTASTPSQAQQEKIQ